LEIYNEIKARTLSQVRGTVQADILKKIKLKIPVFSTEFALRLMGDVQEYLLLKCRNFYSVSISGYHIAEAGANQLRNWLSHFQMDSLM
jgi:methylmalonyl-CoA mutase